MELLQAVTRARGQAKQRLVAVIQRQAPRDWKAAAWILERSFRDEYGKSWRGEPKDPLQPPATAPEMNYHYRFHPEPNGNGL